jgi:hypothetical protein
MPIKREGFRAKPAKVAPEGVSFQNLFAFGCAGAHTQSTSSATQSCPARIPRLRPPAMMMTKRFLVSIVISWFQPQIKCKKHEKHQLQTRAHPAIAIKTNTPEKPIASTWKHSLQPVKKVIIHC